MSELRFQVNRLEIALELEYPPERQPVVTSICGRMQSLLELIEESSAGRTVCGKK